MLGGYASFPILNDAQRTGIPTLLQEQNSFAGKSNKILARRARKVCVAYEGMDKFFPKEKLVLTGNPVRKSISDSEVTRAEGIAAFGLKGPSKVLLVVGGSLGAKSINETVGAALGEIVSEGVQVIWQAGAAYYETAMQQAKFFDKEVKVHAFIREMEYAYAAADVVISRAGALAIAELCIAGKPVIFVPYPFAAEDHQTSNAMALVKHNAAQLIRDADVSTELMPKLKLLLSDYSSQLIMHQALRRLAITDADERIAAEVVGLVDAKDKTSTKRNN